MSEPMPPHDHLDKLATRAAKVQAACEEGEFNLHKRELIEDICRSAKQRPYTVIYRFVLHGHSRPSSAVRKRLRDWVNEQPGYRARLDWEAPRWLRVKVLGENAKKRTWRWPVYLRWIPGLGG